MYACGQLIRIGKVHLDAYRSGRCTWTAHITATTAITAAAEHFHRAQSLWHRERVRQAVSDARYATDRTGTLPVRLTTAVVEPAAVLPSRERDAPPATTMKVTTATTASVIMMTGTTTAGSTTGRRLCYRLWFSGHRSWFPNF